MIELEGRILSEIGGFDFQDKCTINFLFLSDVWNQTNHFQFHEFFILDGKV